MYESSKLGAAMLLLAALATPAAHAQGGVTRFCTSGANGASISASGSASFMPNGGSGDLVLQATELPLGTWGLFVYGNQTLPQTPLGNGFLCVSGSPHIFRLGVLVAGAGETSVSQPIDYLTPPSVAASITPGSSWNFQFWFRDGVSADLTDALEIAFVPPATVDDLRFEYDIIRSGHPLGQNPGGGTLVLNTQAELNAAWDLHTSLSSGTIPPVPPIDMSQRTVVLTFAGMRLSGGFDIRVTDVALSVTSVQVTTVERRPGPGCGGTFGVINPGQIVSFPKIDAATLGEWIPTSSTYSCP